MSTVTVRSNPVKGPPQTKMKRALAKRGITYGQVAAFAGCSYSLVYQVLGGYRKSARVMAAIAKLLGADGARVA